MSNAGPVQDPGAVRRHWLGYFVRHRTAANLLLMLMVVAGVWSAGQIRAQFFPDVVLESATVTVRWAGAGPEDIDRGIVALMAPVLLAVDGVESTSSTARQGTANIVLEFESGWDMARASDDIKAAVDGLTTLPDNAETPVIRLSRFRDRVTDVVIHGDTSVELLARLGDDLRTRLFRAGVTRTTLTGVPDPQMDVTVPEAMLIRHGLSLREVADALADESNADPAGEMRGAGARVRTGSERRSETAIASIPIRSDQTGARLEVRDVADVRLRGSAGGRVYFQRDRPAVVVQVDRNAQGDAIGLQREVESVVDAFRASLPPAVDVRLTRTRSEAITARLTILRDNAAFGLGLVLLVLFAFLSARTAFWVAAGIPVALAATVALMFVAGLTLNMVSLFALIICLGIVVDDAIVVGEHADYLARQGLAPQDAAVAAARRMAAPVGAAALTTIIAFTALTAIGGRFGDLIIDIPFTVSVVLIASLAECFLILPAHMSHALANTRPDAWYDWPNRQVDRAFNAFRERVFEPLMRRLAVTRYVNVAVAVAALLFCVAMLVDGTVRWRFFNAPERGTVSANIAMLPGASREDTRAMLVEMGRALDVVAGRYADRHGTSPVAFSLSTLGGTTGRGLRGAGAKDADLLGGFSIELIDPDDRPYSAFTFIGDWRAEIRRSQQLELLALRGGRSGPGGDAIDVQLLGPDPATLKTAAEELKRTLAAFPAVSALEDTLAWDKREITLTLTPKGKSLGFSTADIGRELYQRIEGIEAAEYPLGTRTLTVVVKLPDDELGAEFLTRTRLRTPSGGWVALEELVNVSTRAGFSSVRRENGVRTLRVTGDVSEDGAEAADEVKTALAETLLPDLAARYGLEWTLRGLSEQENRFLADAKTGLALCLAGIYMVLAWVFASWWLPLSVMLVIPLGLIGTIIGHQVHGVPLSMFSVVGFIGMSGIIVNDSIVLITTVGEQARDHALREAVLRAVSKRLRAVLLTTATTVLGLMPLLFEHSRQAQFLMPTVITLVWGLGFGMFLVLVVTPSLVLIQFDVLQAFRSARRFLRAARSGRLGSRRLQPVTRID